MNPKLLEAVAIFKELGWENVAPENVLSLPLGTPEQKRTALAGLKSGEWGKIVQLSKNSWGWRNHFDVDAGKLALFAVRVGVDARRAVNVLRKDKMVVDVVAERGEKYASDFIGHACVSRRRGSEHLASAFGSEVVKLVDKLNLEIPQNVEYMKDWSVYAANAMGLKAQTHYQETDFPGLDLIERRFAEHIQIGAAVGVPATGPFGRVLPAGVKRGLYPRDKAVDLVFTALDAAARHGDRKILLGVLDEFSVSDEEFARRAQALIPLLASGDGAMITRLAPMLIAQVDDNLLAEVLLACFSAPTNKAKQLALKSALGRPRPENAEDLSSWLSILAGDKDKTVASLASRLIKQWEVDADVLPEEKPEVRGLWRETPPVWQPPPFELGEVSPEALTALAAKMVNNPESIHDVTAEHFLAMANALARQDVESARMSLRGIRPRDQFLYRAVCWVREEQPSYGADESKKNGVQDLLTARDYVVFQHLGKLPCLLSTPSVVDLSISVSDLAARLALYRETGTDALEADLFLALTRLDEKTKTPQAASALEKLDVPVVLQSGKKMPVGAGQAALKYLDDPVKEPSMKVNDGHWGKTELTKPSSLSNFPDRFHGYYFVSNYVFPLWGDTALREAHWNGEVYHHKGLVLRQAARRAAPLPPGASINFLAAQRSSTPHAQEDSTLAVIEAWERGLLRPGVADVAFLDWTTRPPSNLAALAAALDGIARDGLLSVVWPVLDALIVASLKAPRLLAGTAELAELVEAFLPEAQSAVERGVADSSTLDLPGIRALSRQGGSSRAVTAAKKVAALLPPDKAEHKKDENAAPVMETPFDEVWPARKKEAVIIDDGVALTVGLASPTKGRVYCQTSRFLFTLTLPGVSDRVFQVVKDGWDYDLRSEGQCQAHAVAPGTAFEYKKENKVWLHWDAKQKTMAVCEHRNWIEGKDGSLPKGTSPPPLSFSLLTMILGLLAQDGDAMYFAPRLLRDFIGRGQIDAEVVRRATWVLLQNPVVSPGKLVRVLEKDIKLLPVLWPILTESIKAAGELVAAGESPPIWVNRILDNALRYAPYLAEAARRGNIDAKWAGVSEIASSKAKSTAVAKAKKLSEVFNEDKKEQ